MMQKLIDFAEDNGYCEIYGNLSTVDLDHKNKLHHFYEKFGFVITIYSQERDCFYGEVHKTIKTTMSK